MASRQWLLHLAKTSQKLRNIPILNFIRPYAVSPTKDEKIAYRSSSYFEKSHGGRLTDRANMEEKVPDVLPETLEQCLEAAEDDQPINMVNPYTVKVPMCVMCKYNLEFDYKNPKLIAQFMSPFSGTYYSRNITRLCKRQHQKLIAQHKKAVQCGFIASYHKDVAYLKDPALFDARKPLNRNPYW